MSSALFQKFRDRGLASDANKAVSEARCREIESALNTKQRSPLDAIRAGFHYISIRCPRRAGKSHCMTSLALWYGEMFPGSRILIISLTLKTTKENYWSGAPGGIYYHNHRFSLGLHFNVTDAVWYHQNGSRGRLAGAETRADMEYLRGAAAEADICIIDECKSFAPDHLAELIRDVIEPGLMTRDGILIMGGTPGSIPVGTFYEATSELARVGEGEESRPTCVPWGQEDTDLYARIPVDEKPDLWRLFTWTILDNEARPQQWKRALKIKAKEKWSDDHPSWRREYLGEWVTDATDLVYAWAGVRAKGDVCVTWTPNEDDITKDNPTGLPAELGPWHLVLGLDIGYVDESAFVLAAYSETIKELRHVYDFKRSEMLCDDFTEEVLSVIDRFGMPEAIVADTAGGGSKMLIETINARHGIGIIPAVKTDKQAWFELINSDFHAGRIKIIPHTDLAHELAGLQWDLSRNSKTILARMGALKEDPKCPNHLTDALLYLFKYAHHYYSSPADRGPEKGSVQWIAQQAKLELENARARKKASRKDPYGLSRKRPETASPWN